MAKAKDLVGEAAVSAHIAQLDKAIKPVVEAVRQTILSADKNISEQIKWNNPAFFYSGEMKPFDPKEYKRDIAVFNLFKNRIMLVLPSGAKLDDKEGILEGDYKDGRRFIIFTGMEDVKAKEKPLLKLIKQWIKLVDK